jgi:CheY-like chemotaxis protein
MKDDGQSFRVALLDAMMPEVDGIELARRIKAEPALAKTAIIIISSVGSKKDFGTAADGIDVADWLMKPVRRQVLYDCLIKAVSPKSEASLRSISAGQDHSAQDSRQCAAVDDRPLKRPLRALLAEDNPLNQKVARLQLKKLDVEVDLAANGREAIEALGRFPYDVVFMDCQMPEVYGYEATRQIRRLEGSMRHTWIVAMTANALPSDREKCLEAGMDDYISKPLRPGAFREVLLQVGALPSVAIDPAPPSGADSGIIAGLPAMGETIPEKPVESQTWTTKAANIATPLAPVTAAATGGSGAPVNAESGVSPRPGVEKPDA